MINVIKQEIDIEECDDIFINGYYKKIKFKDLKNKKKNIELDVKN